MKFIVLVGSLLFGAVLSQTEDAVAETGVDASTEGGKRAFGFGGPRSGKGFSPQNFQKRPARNADGNNAAGTEKCEGKERKEGFKGFPKGGVPEGGFKGPKGGLKWGKKPVEGEAVVVENTSV